MTSLRPERWVGTERRRRHTSTTHRCRFVRWVAWAAGEYRLTCCECHRLISATFAGPKDDRILDLADGNLAWDRPAPRASA